jgi:hypothetical protein
MCGFPPITKKHGKHYSKVDHLYIYIYEYRYNFFFKCDMTFKIMIRLKFNSDLFELATLFFKNN